jgi:dihydrofolate synthase/folylpolyglutamate synthase
MWRRHHSRFDDMTATRSDLAAVLDDLKQLHPVKIDLSLERITVLLDKLDRPQDRLPPVLHVAGTNGKGSTVAFLRAMLEADGYRTHTYTSPHLVSFTERIRLGGTGANGSAAPIDEDRLIEVLRHVSAVNAGAPITFFEVTTAAAFLAFADTPADALILEVGLGGRLDATNLVERPAVSIITPISLDHREMLGETLAEIAVEKAGIFKSGVPAIVAPQPPEAGDALADQASRIGAPLQAFGEDFDAYEQNGRLVYQSEQRLLDLPLPGLIGRHQVVNAGTSVAAALALATPHISEDAIARGVAGARWPGRFVRLDRGALVSSAGELTEVWLDGGHNPAAGSALAQALADLDERAPKPVYLVVAMMANKDARNFLVPFAGLVRGIVAIPLAGHEEGSFAPDALCDIAESVGLDAVDEDDARSAINAIEAWDVGPKRVLICGSLYLAGHILHENAE